MTGKAKLISLRYFHFLEKNIAFIILGLVLVLSLIPLAWIYAPSLSPGQSTTRFWIEPNCDIKPRTKITVFEDNNDVEVSMSIARGATECDVALKEQITAPVFTTSLGGYFKSEGNTWPIKPAILNTKNGVSTLSLCGAGCEYQSEKGIWFISFRVEDGLRKLKFSEYELALDPRFGWPELRRRLRNKNVHGNGGVEDSQTSVGGQIPPLTKNPPPKEPVVLKRDNKIALAIVSPRTFVFQSSLPYGPVSYGGTDKSNIINILVRPKGSELRIRYKKPANESIEQIIMFLSSAVFGFVLGVMVDRGVLNKA